MGIGLGITLVGATALLIMHITQMIPYRGSTHRQEDPEAYRRYWFAYLIMVLAGVIMALLAWLAG